MLVILGVDIALEDSGHGGIGFRQMFRGLNGFQLYCEPVNETPTPYLSVNLPSKCLQNVGFDRVFAAYNWLCEKGCEGMRWKVSRADLAFDTQLFTVGQVVHAYRMKKIDTKARYSDEDKEHSYTPKNIRGRGHTFYLGSRSSSAFLRVYRKLDGVSFGEQTFTRVELQLMSDRAFAAVLEIMAAPVEDMARMACAWLRGFLSIATKWWQKFVKNIPRSWFKKREPVPTIASIRNWLYHQVSASLATYVSALSGGGDAEEISKTIQHLLLDGQRKMSARHEKMVEHYNPDASPIFEVFSMA